jgi:lambda family phage portal protein
VVLKPTLRLGGVGTNGTSDMAMGGGLQGAQTLDRALATWSPDLRPIDALIGPGKEILDARSRDMTMNDGFVGSAQTLTQDSIVGTQFVLNATPNAKMLGVEPDSAWVEEFQSVVENRFNVLGDSDRNWLDAQRVKNFTDIIRLAVGQFVVRGEVLAVAEWERSPERPFKTAVQMVNPDRLSNPNDMEDTVNIRRGVARNASGAQQAYWIRKAHRFSPYAAAQTYEWARVEAYLPWGRSQVLHIFEQQEADQSRGVAQMVSVLKEMRMTRKYRDIVLQNAVINSMYAAAVESELPADVVFGQLGSQANPDVTTPVMQYMQGLMAYVGDANGLRLDGAKIPHLYPGTKLKMIPAGQIGDTKYEQSLLRHLAAAFGLSYEEFSRDFSQTNYSSARAAMMMSWRHMTSKKRKAADGTARWVYGLWLEEQVNAGEVPMPPGMTAADFYRPGVREALTCSTWIGAARGQIDEGKETDAAIARIGAGLSTREDELARLGKDWRIVIPQLAREQRLLEKHKVVLDTAPRAVAPADPTVDQRPGDPAAPAQ